MTKITIAFSCAERRLEIELTPAEAPAFLAELCKYGCFNLINIWSEYKI